MMKNNVLVTVLTVLLVALLIIGFYQKKYNNLTKNAAFAKEYKVRLDNPFEQINGQKALSMLEKGTGLLYIGFPECPWCVAYIQNLDKRLREEKIAKVYYYNIKKDRTENNDVYQAIVKKLDKHLRLNDLGNAKRIYVPVIVGLEKGKVFFFDDETSYDTRGLKDPKKYWDKESLKKHNLKLNDLLKKIKKLECTSCNI